MPQIPIWNVHTYVKLYQHGQEVHRETLLPSSDVERKLSQHCHATWCSWNTDACASLTHLGPNWSGQHCFKSGQNTSTRRQNCPSSSLQQQTAQSCQYARAVATFQKLSPNVQRRFHLSCPYPVTFLPRHHLPFLAVPRSTVSQPSSRCVYTRQLQSFDTCTYIILAQAVPYSYVQNEQTVQWTCSLPSKLTVLQAETDFASTQPSLKNSQPVSMCLEPTLSCVLTLPLNLRWSRGCGNPSPSPFLALSHAQWPGSSQSNQ